MEEAPTTALKSEELNEIPERPSRSWLRILGFALLGLVVASGIFAAGYFFGQSRQVTPSASPTPVVQITPIPTPTPDPTADWKTYMNAKYGYSIKYPKEWQVFEAKEGPEAEIRTDFAESDSLSGREWWVWIKTNNNPDGLSATKWVDRLLFQYSDQPAVIAEIGREKDKVAGIEAERVTGLPAMTETVSVFIPKEEKMYEIVLQKGIGTLSGESKETFNLMLSTFRFLEEVEGWKSFSNTQLKFSLKYPEDWHVYNIDPSSTLITSLSHNPAHDEKYTGLLVHFRTDLTPESLAESRRLIRWTVDGVKISGVDGFKAYPSSQAEIQSPEVDWYFSNKTGTGTFEIQGVYYVGDKESNLQTFDQILFTFRFLE